MPRGRVKIKKTISNGSDDANVLNDMFAQMTGTNHADPEIIIPKFLKLHCCDNGVECE